ncbi:MAG: hypothetical protein ABJB12_15000 [Pseudomonadota bacterium]
MRRASLGRAALAAALMMGVLRDARAVSPAAAAPLSVTLEYDVPSGCPDERDFRSIVSQRLGRDPFVQAASNRVSVVVSPADTTISGELVWRDDTGNSRGAQHFPSKTNHCAQLIQAMGFALAVQIQLLEVEDAGTPKASGQDAQPSSPTPPEPTSPPKQVAPKPEAPTPVTHRPQRDGMGPRLFVGGGGAIAVGMAPRPVAGARVFAGLRWPLAALEFALEGSAPVTVRRADGAGYSQWYLLASAAGCGVFEPGSVCALLKAGTVRVAGRDIDVPNSAGAALVQSGVRLALSQHLSASTSLSLRGEGLLNLTRWSATLDRLPVWSASRLALDSGLDLVVLFR